MADCAYKVCNEKELEFAIEMLSEMKVGNRLDKEEEKELILLKKSLELIKNEPKLEKFQEEPLYNKQKV